MRTRNEIAAARNGRFGLSGLGLVLLAFALAHETRSAETQERAPGEAEQRIDRLEKDGRLSSSVAQEARRLLSPSGAAKDVERDLVRFVKELARGELTPSTYLYLRQLLMEQYYTGALEKCRESMARKDYYSAVKHAERARSFWVSDRSGASTALCEALIGRAQERQKRGACREALELLERAARLRVSPELKRQVSGLREQVDRDMVEYDSLLAKARALADGEDPQQAHELLCEAIGKNVDDKSAAQDMLAPVAEAAYDAVLVQAKQALADERFHPDARRLLSEAVNIRGAETQTALELLRDLPPEEGSATWYSLEAALRKADEDSRIVFVDFYADWCVWCKRFEDTLMDERVAAELPGFVAARVYDKERPDLLRKYGVTGFPTIAFLEADGEVLQILGGYKKPDEFLAVLRAIEAIPAGLPARRAALAKNPEDVAANMWMAAYFARRKEKAKSRLHYSRALEGLAAETERNKDTALLEDSLPLYRELVELREGTWDALVAVADKLASPQARARFLSCVDTATREDATAQMAVGQARERHGMDAEAGQAYDRAMELTKKDLERNRTHPFYLAALGRCHYLRGDYAQADRLSQQALKRYPKAVEARRTIALAQLAQGNVDAALREFGRTYSGKPPSAVTDGVRDLAKRRPDVHETAFALGYLYDKAGDTAQSLKHYGRYLRAVSDGPLAERARGHAEPLLLAGLRHLRRGDSGERKDAAEDLASFCDRGEAFVAKVGAAKTPARALACVLVCVASPDSRRDLHAALSTGETGKLRTALEQLASEATQSWVRAGAVMALGELGSVQCCGRLAESLKDGEPEVRCEGARALGCLAAALGGVGSASDSQEPAPVFSAAEIGQQSKAAVSGLRRALDDEDVTVRAAAAGALLRFSDPRGYEVLSLLGKSVSGDARSFAGQAWTEASGEGRDASAVVEAVRERSPELAEEILEALAQHFYTEGQRLSNEKQYEAAQALLEVAAELSPSAGIYNWLGHVLSNRNRIEDALSIYRKSLELDPASSYARSSLGRCHAMLGHGAEALEHYRKRVEQGGSASQVKGARHQMARLLVERGDFGEAIELYRGLHRGEPGDTALALEYGWTLLRADRPGDACALAEETMRAKRGLRGCRLLLGFARLQEGDNDKALESLRACAGSPGEADAGTDTAGFLHASAVGVDLVTRVGRAHALDQDLGTALQREAATVLVRRAKKLADSGWVKEPQRLLRSAVTLGLDEVGVQTQAALAALRVGLKQEAQQVLAAAVAGSSDSAPAKGNLGWALYLAGNYDEALKQSMRALALDPAQAFVHGNVGLIHVRSGDLDSALRHYDQMVAAGSARNIAGAVGDLVDLAAAEPNLAAVDYALGYCHEKAGDFGSARRCYERFLSKKKEGESARKAAQCIAEWDAPPALTAGL